jgi:hypothetical protein
MFVENTNQKIQSTVGVTRKKLYTCQGYAPYTFAWELFYKHFGATHLFYLLRNIKLITLGASPRYVCRKRKQRIEHRRCDT